MDCCCLPQVDRDSDGKEIRYPIILTAKEKLIARKVICMHMLNQLTDVFISAFCFHKISY